MKNAILIFSFLLCCLAFGRSSEFVDSGQTDQVMGVTGGAGDYLKKIVCYVTTSGSADVSISDGGGSAEVVLSDGVALGPYQIEYAFQGLQSSSGDWRITTDDGVSCHVFGEFQ